MAANGSFKQLGNLAFYNGWSPNYVYFNTLYAMADMDNLKKDSWSGIDRKAASAIAQKAIDDARQYQHLNGMDPESANDAIQTKMQEIIHFLSYAIRYEEENETKYFNKKFNELSNVFTDEEKKQIPQLRELTDALKDHNSSDYYQKYITMINILLSGLNNTKEIAKHEAEHIKQVNDAVEGIVSRHKNQITGLYDTRYSGRTNKKGKSYQLATMIERSEKNLRENIRIQYLEHHNLTSGTYSERTVQHKDKTSEVVKKTRFLLGSKGAFAKINNTIDVELAHWATATIKKVVADKTLTRRIVKAIEGKYPKDANWEALVPEIKQQIILVIQQMGLKDLGKAIKKKVTKQTCREVVDELIKDQDLFNMVASYRVQINGLYNNYGQIGRASALMKEANEISDLEGENANNLYETISQLIKISNSKTLKLTDEQSYLIDVFDHNEQHYWEGAEEMDTLIKRIEALQKYLSELNKRKKNNDLELDELYESEFKLGQDAQGQDVILTFALDGNKVVINTESTSLATTVAQTREFQAFDFKKFTGSRVDTMAATLKSRASKQLRDHLVEQMQAVYESDTNDLEEDEIIQKVKQGLENMHISVSGPKVSELSSAIQLYTRGDNLVVDWAGGINGKNDVVVISIDDLVSSVNLQKTQDIYAQKIVKNIQPELLEAREEFTKQWHKEIQQTIKTTTKKNYPKKYTHVARAFLKNAVKRDAWSKELTDAYTKLQEAWTHQKNILEKRGLREERLKELKMQFLNSLASSFYVSTTVKTYNTYLNNMGFVGGSLGTTLDSQLTRLADIFSLSGLSIDEDLKWLKSAIINCSPLTIAQESNKNLIENYLGSMAAFALFDEGGAEGRLISNYMKELENNTVKKAHINPNIIHLYRVNGIYVPGSYVLRQVYNALTNTVMPLIDSIDNTMRAGATVEIINNVSTSMIPNRPIATTSRPKTSAWTLVGRAAAKNTRIEILFLAGLMDIANSINKELSNIPVPI